MKSKKTTLSSEGVSLVNVVKITTAELWRGEILSLSLSLSGSAPNN
ncbi:MAG: hypothetical protein LBQ02_03600 [Candidatus Nomurabacteria bacterium]|jgi:hypothetical protein|nr:hypothetical protein [Candidatus Nomurabacteria bacterium]